MELGRRKSGRFFAITRMSFASVSCLALAGLGASCASGPQEETGVAAAAVSVAGVPCTALAEAVIANTGAVFSDSGSLVDSYHSSQGPYGGSNIGSQGAVQAATTIAPNGGVIHGTETQGSPAGLGVVPVPPGATNLPLGSPTPGSLNINNAAQSITLAPGNYVAANVNVSSPGAINVSPPGPVLIWVTGNLNLGGNENPNGVPANLQFLVQSSGFVNVNGGGKLFGFIYAPTSVVNLDSTVFGGVVGSTVNLNSGSAVHFDQDQAATCPAPLPFGNDGNGLIGNLNYLIYSNCQPLQNPTATIALSSPMNAGPGGFDFQFNANSLATPANPNGATLSGQPSHMGWQQYIINVRAGAAANTTEVSGFIEPWPSFDPNVSNGSDLVNTSGLPLPLVTLTQTPTPTLPAGTQLSITLVTDPTTLAVTDLTFGITLPPGTPTDPTADPTYFNDTPIPLVGLARDGTLCGNPAQMNPPDPRFCPNPAAGPGTVTTADLTPVTSFQLDFAGFVMNSAAGTITYTASSATPLFPVPPSAQNTGFPFVPTCSVGAITAESSNVVYSTMQVDGDTQSFGISLDCESGTGLYFFECDGKPFCATPQNAAQCLGNGFCFLSPWTNAPAPSGATCNDVAPFEDRDPLGAWLSQVTYP